jgi:hypothetical protein
MIEPVEATVSTEPTDVNRDTVVPGVDNMNPTDPTDESELVRWITALVYGVVIFENSFAFLGAFIWSPAYCFLLVAALLSLSSFLLRWLPYTGMKVTRALLWTGVAGAAWPWTSFVLFAVLKLLRAPGNDLAWWFGPWIPYGTLLFVGSRKLGVKSAA